MPKSNKNPLAAFSQVGHPFFARDGVKLAFGKRWDGKTIHVSEAARGAACGCRCPAQNCGRKLIARKPDSEIQHHFAHAPLTASERLAGIAPNCKHGNMTALHAYAEQLLSAHKCLVLPPVGATLGQRSRTMRNCSALRIRAKRRLRAPFAQPASRYIFCMRTASGTC
jgi:hypothetical protein